MYTPLGAWDTIINEMTDSYYMKRVLLAVMTGLLLSLASLSLARAAPAQAEDESIAVTPAKKYYEFEVGSSVKDYITIINPGSQAFTFKVTTAPFSVNGDAYETDFLTIRKNTDFHEWVTFNKTSYTIQPGESIEVAYTVSIPSNATPGGHYGVLFAETQLPSDTKETTALKRQSRVGAVVYATVKGDYTSGGQFKEIRIPGLQFKSPLRSELSLENTGVSHFAVDTTFAVSDIFGNRKITDEKQYDMLPQTSRKIPLKWDKSPGFGLYQITVHAKFLDQETSKTSYVLMAPLAYYMIFVVALLVVVAVFILKRR